MNIEDALRLFLDAQNSALLSPKTLVWYEYEVRQFLTWLEKQPECNGDWAQPNVIERYLGDARRRGLAPATIGLKYRGLRGFFGWLTKRGYLKTSPVQKAPPPQVPKKEPRRTELTEYVSLIDSIPQITWVDLRDRLIINLLFLCGLRLGECAALRPDDFRIKESILVVRQGKSGNARFIPLLPPVLAAFVAYVYARPNSKAELFVACDGSGVAEGALLPGGIRQMLKRRCTRAGLRNLNPHAFRHGLAVYLLNKGGDMSLVQRILGHSRISTTAEHYAAWLTEDVVRIYSDKMKDVETRR